MKIAICDDSLQDREEIINNVLDFSTEHHSLEFFQFENGESLLQAYENGAYFDIVFLDVEMEQINGIDVGKKIRTFQKKLIIIFVSRHSQYAIPAYDCEPLYFITKPIEKKHFFQVCTKALEKYKSYHQFYILQSKGQAHKIPISDLIYVEICHKHIMFYTSYETFETTQSTLKEVFAALRPHGFIQVHQAILVNPSYIRSIQDLTITLNNNVQLAMSVRKKSDTLRAYANYLEGEI